MWTFWNPFGETNGSPASRKWEVDFPVFRPGRIAIQVNFSFSQVVGIVRESGSEKVKAMGTTTKIFTIEQARAMLPLLRLIVTDIALSHRELTERKSNLRRMLRRHDGKPRFQIYDAEIAEIQEDLKTESAHLEDYVSELERLGVVLRSAHDGIVDFPAIIDERSAYYTWQMDQPDIVDFHWAAESTANRKPIYR